MKNKVWLVLLAFLSFALISCNKCQDCTTTSVKTISPDSTGFPRTTEVKVELCGDDLKGMDGKTESDISNEGNYTIKSISETVCE